MADLEHLVIKSKNGGGDTKVPYQLLVMFAILLVLFAGKLLEVVRPSGDGAAAAAVVAAGKLDVLIEEHRDVNRLHHDQLKKDDQQIMLQAQQIELMRDIADDMQEHRIKMENGR